MTTTATKIQVIRGTRRSRSLIARGARIAGPPATSIAQTAPSSPSATTADQGQRIGEERRRDVAVQECGAHPGATAQRAVPSGQRPERTRQPQAGRRVHAAERQTAGEEPADVAQTDAGPERPARIDGDMGHPIIVPPISAKSRSSGTGPADT